MTSQVNTQGVDLSNPSGISGAVNVLDTAGGTKLAAAVVVVDQFGAVTQFAQEGGNLAEIAASTGAQTDAIYAGSGSTGIIGALKGIYSKVAAAASALAGTLAVNGAVSVTNLPSTQSISGTVALDAPSLAALESITVQNFPVTQPVSATALPLPTGAAKETGGNLDAISAATGTTADAGWSGSGVGTIISLLKSLWSKLPSVGQQVMAASQPVVIASDQSPIPITGSIAATSDFWASVLHALEYISEGPQLDPASGRLRVVLDAAGGAQTLGTVTTVSTVTTCSTVTTVSTLTSMSQIAGVAANSMVYDAIDNTWGACVRGRIA